jgi:hypothetical protein
VPLGLPPRALAVDPRQGRVVVLTSEEFGPSAPAGQVHVLEGRTGRFLRTVAVGADATARWLPQPWVLRLLPPTPVTATGTVTMLDLTPLWALRRGDGRPPCPPSFPPRVLGLAQGRVVSHHT